ISTMRNSPTLVLSLFKGKLFKDRVKQLVIYSFLDIIRNITTMGMIQMKVSFNIFLRDIKNIGTNWVALILIGGLILLPSLYAWFNIAASWDPYSQTEQIPIGIVNEDEGAIVREQEIHVGEELIETLKDNKSMGWQFVNRNEAMERLEYGDYYAVIVIPKNFSESLGTVI